MTIEQQDEGMIGEAFEDNTADAGSDEDREADEAIGAELRQVGDRLAAAIRAAVGTDEAEALRSEVGEGIRRLKEEFEEALERVPRPRGKKSASDEGGDEHSESATGSRRTALRRDVASALRSWAERAAASIEPKADESAQWSDDADGSDTA